MSPGKECEGSPVDRSPGRGDTVGRPRARTDGTVGRWETVSRPASTERDPSRGDWGARVSAGSGPVSP